MPRTPARGFLPATGTLHHLRFPDASRARVRVETGVRAGDAISPYYDPMIAKLVVHGPDRAAALAALAAALAGTEIAGSTTNTAFLARAGARCRLCRRRCRHRPDRPRSRMQLTHNPRRPAPAAFGRLRLPPQAPAPPPPIAIRGQRLPAMRISTR